MNMPAFESHVFNFLLNSLWQAPLLFLGAWATARVVRPVGPRAEHRVWVIALLLEAIVPACRFHLVQLWTLLSRWLEGVKSGDTGGVRVLQRSAALQHAGQFVLPASLRAAAVVAYGLSLLYFGTRLAWGLWKTDAMRRDAEPLSEEATFKLRGKLDGLRVGVSPMLAGPVTVGLVRPTLLLPRNFVETVSAVDLETVVAHEAAHVERRDFAKNLLYELLAVVIAYHPLAWATRSRIAETREMVCDRMAAGSRHGQEHYARSLLRLASMLVDRKSAGHLHAIGIFDANIFKRRIMNLTQRHFPMSKTHRLLTTVACGLLGLLTCGTALALRMEVAPATPRAAAEESRTAKALNVPSGMMAGQKISGENPKYPEEAKASGDTIDGSVVLSAVIGKDGSVENLKVQKSLRDDYDQSALDAVRTWKYKPYLLNGDPVEVETTVQVTYAIGK